MTKKPKLKSALKKKEFKKWLESLSHKELAIINAQLHNLIWSWLGNITIDIFNELWVDLPYLNIVFDKKIIESRFDVIDKFDSGHFGVHIKDFWPELDEIRIKTHERLNKETSGVTRAELWLLPDAINSRADSSSEALIYFASRGEILMTSHEIKRRWHNNICFDIQRGSIFRVIPEKIKERAKENLISLSEASEILSKDGSLPRFFAFRDEEEDFIDASFLRTVEWLNVEGFNPWVDSTINNLNASTQYGVEHYKFSWDLFYYVRSNLFIEKSPKVALESLLWILINGPIEKDKPWVTNWHLPSGKGYEKASYLPIASSIIFVWQRINPQGIDNAILDNATSVLYSTQLEDGSWPITSIDVEGSIMSTCFSIHALCLYKPLGWQNSCKKGVEWLKDQQNESGFWYIQGGPATMMTVFALDSISLFEGGKTTFDNNSLLSLKESENKHELDISNEDWFKKPIPKIQSKSKDDVITTFRPKIAIVCAVEIELQYILKELEPSDENSKIIKVVDGTETYYLGKFGFQNAVITMSTMGTQGPSGSILSIESLIRIWDPIVITMVGIAFGIDKTKHNPGDVLVANSIIPYENQKVSKGEINYRNPIPVSSPALLNRIRNVFGWEFKRPDGTIISKHIGPLLSGEKLVNDIKFKEQLTSEYPNAIGGEMESSGVWSSASKHNKQWIVMKSVCDWADGEKNDDYQALAAATSVSLCKFIFEDEFTLEGIR
jgi:nucleoside phosphorylase|tara:strand:- start:57 stop:2228 length:2172 start_codon:yes stop_codon:yes gene_type:complete